MAHKVIISENMEKVLIDSILEESVYYPSYEKVLLVKNFLDKNFSIASVPDVSSNGLPTYSKVVNILNANKEVVNTINTDALFYMLQEKFKAIEKDTENRDKLLKQVIKDWMNGSITREGGLTVNSI